MPASSAARTHARAFASASWLPAVSEFPNAIRLTTGPSVPSRRYSMGSSCSDRAGGEVGAVARDRRGGQRALHEGGTGGGRLLGGAPAGQGGEAAGAGEQRLGDVGADEAVGLRVAAVLARVLVGEELDD